MNRWGRIDRRDRRTRRTRFDRRNRRDRRSRCDRRDRFNRRSKCDWRYRRDRRFKRPRSRYVSPCRFGITSEAICTGRSHFHYVFMGGNDRFDHGFFDDDDFRCRVRSRDIC